MLFGIDEGNTSIKVVGYSNKSGRIINKIQKFSSPESFADEFPHHSDDEFLLCSTQAKSNSVVQFIQKKIRFNVDHIKSLPFSSRYTSRLGADRIAGVFGALREFTPPFLMISMGTCLTYNLVNSQKFFLGGAISPGLLIRLRSMHQFTGKLPPTPFDSISQIPDPLDTKKAMLNGTLEGILFELKGRITKHQKEHQGLQIILTGGDAHYFEKLMEMKIFVRPQLNFDGLYSLYKHVSL